jgi:hypothetical protein
VLHIAQWALQIFAAEGRSLRVGWRAMNCRRRAWGLWVLVLLPVLSAGCADDKPSWVDLNQRVIDEHKVTGRTRDLPRVSVPMVLADGQPVERAKLPTITIAPGVTAALGWGRGALVERLDMQADAAYPSQTLNEELFVIVQDGSATIDVGGKTAELTKDHAIYLQPGDVTPGDLC